MAGGGLGVGLLRDAGARVTEARDGVEALELARDQRPDLILADVSMPRLDGLGLCAALREEPELQGVAVVLLAHGEPPQAVWGSDAASRPLVDAVLAALARHQAEPPATPGPAAEADGSTVIRLPRPEERRAGDASPEPDEAAAPTTAAGQGAADDGGEAGPALDAAGLSPEDQVDLVLEPGDIALWSPYLVHASGTNTAPHLRRFYINGYVRAEDCDRGEWTFRDGQPVALGAEQALVHYEQLRERPEPHFV